ncbi:hypothetical protein [Methylomagnum sp.]
MQVQELPPLPFKLDLRSASEWLDRLPVSNIRETCRLLFPMLQLLNLYPMAPRLRFDILEHSRPIVFSLTRNLQPHLADRTFPLDSKTRKIATLSARFHLEAAMGYRLLLEDTSFGKVFAASERLAILRWALENLAYGQLRTAQVYEVPSSSASPTLQKLYAYALTNRLLDEFVATERERPATFRELFASAGLFQLAAPGRLAAAEMQRLFDRLWLRGGMDGLGLEADEGGRQAVFWFDPAAATILVPALPSAPPAPDLPYISAEKFVAAWNAATRSGETPEDESFRRVWRRLGERLPCPENMGRRRVVLSVGFVSIVSMLWNIEARQSAPKRRTGGVAWSGLGGFELAPTGEFAPQDNRPAKFKGRPRLADLVASAELTDEERTVEVVPTEFPGFYLMDSGRLALRAGLLVGLNSDNHHVQLGVLRGGQIRDGRYWHSFELIGDRVRPVRVTGSNGKDDKRNGFIVVDPAGHSASLIVPPGKWRRDDTVTVYLLDGQPVVHLAKLLEATADFCHFLLAESVG